jgi:hypothetical protein
MVYGLTFTTGNSSNVSINFSNRHRGRQKFRELHLCNSERRGSSASFQFNNGNSGRTTFRGCNFFSSTSQNMVAGGFGKFVNCTFAASGTVPSGALPESQRRDRLPFRGLRLQCPHDQDHQ